jgi:uncharacterized protein YdeI (YjbR/CyaY-like superfamily)
VSATGRRPTAASAIEVPADFLQALRRNRNALALFDVFAPSHKREYIAWISEAKRERTRQKRIETAVVRITGARSRKHTR